MSWPNWPPAAGVAATIQPVPPPTVSAVPPPSIAGTVAAAAPVAPGMNPMAYPPPTAAAATAPGTPQTYTAAQYAALTPEQQYALQQNWQQWQSYHEQYARWHAQYGEQYQREMQAKLGSAAPQLPFVPPPTTAPAYPNPPVPTGVPAPVPPVPYSAPPPPPPDNKPGDNSVGSQLSSFVSQPPPPPPPPEKDDPKPNQMPFYSQPPPQTQQQQQQQQYSQQAPNKVPSLLDMPPPNMSGWGGGNDGGNQRNRDDQNNQGRGFGRGGGRDQDRRDRDRDQDRRSFGGSDRDRDRDRRSRFSEGGFNDRRGGDRDRDRGGDFRDRNDRGDFRDRNDRGNNFNDRRFNDNRDDNRGGMNAWQNQPKQQLDEPNKPRSIESYIGDPADGKTPEERAFDEQFRKWEEQFEAWKKQNANHPDRVAYREYEMKFEDCRRKLLERREQMRLRKLQQQGQNVPPLQPPPGLAGEESQSSEVGGGDAKSTSASSVKDGEKGDTQADMDLVNDENTSDSIQTGQTAEAEGGGVVEFLRTKSDGGIPGLDLVPSFEEPNLEKSGKDDEVAEVTEVINLDEDENRSAPPNPQIPSLLSQNFEPPRPGAVDAKPIDSNPAQPGQLPNLASVLANQNIMALLASALGKNNTNQPGGQSQGQVGPIPGQVGPIQGQGGPIQGQGGPVQGQGMTPWQPQQGQQQDQFQNRNNFNEGPNMGNNFQNQNQNFNSPWMNRNQPPPDNRFNQNQPPWGNNQFGNDNNWNQNNRNNNQWQQNQFNDNNRGNFGGNNDRFGGNNDRNFGGGNNQRNFGGDNGRNFGGNNDRNFSGNNDRSFDGGNQGGGSVGRDRGARNRASRWGDAKDADGGNENAGNNSFNQEGNTPQLNDRPSRWGSKEGNDSDSSASNPFKKAETGAGAVGGNNRGDNFNRQFDDNRNSRGMNRRSDFERGGGPGGRGGADQPDNADMSMNPFKIISGSGSRDRDRSKSNDRRSQRSGRSGSDRDDRKRFNPFKESGGADGPPPANVPRLDEINPFGVGGGAGDGFNRRGAGPNIGNSGGGKNPFVDNSQGMQGGGDAGGRMNPFKKNEAPGDDFFKPTQVIDYQNRSLNDKRNQGRGGGPAGGDFKAGKVVDYGHGGNRADNNRRGNNFMPPMKTIDYGHTSGAQNNRGGGGGGNNRNNNNNRRNQNARINPFAEKAEEPVEQPKDVEEKPEEQEVEAEAAEHEENEEEVAGNEEEEEVVEDEVIDADEENAGDDVEIIEDEEEGEGAEGAEGEEECEEEPADDEVVECEENEGDEEQEPAEEDECIELDNNSMNLGRNAGGNNRSQGGRGNNGNNNNNNRNRGGRNNRGGGGNQFQNRGGNQGFGFNNQGFGGNNQGFGGGNQGFGGNRGFGGNQGGFGGGNQGFGFGGGNNDFGGNQGFDNDFGGFGGNQIGFGGGNFGGGGGGGNRNFGGNDGGKGNFQGGGGGGNNRNNRNNRRNRNKSDDFYDDDDEVMEENEQQYYDNDEEQNYDDDYVSDDSNDIAPWNRDDDDYSYRSNKSKQQNQNRFAENTENFNENFDLNRFDNRPPIMNDDSPSHWQGRQCNDDEDENPIPNSDYDNNYSAVEPSTSPRESDRWNFMNPMPPPNFSYSNEPVPTTSTAAPAAQVQSSFSSDQQQQQQQQQMFAPPPPPSFLHPISHRVHKIETISKSSRWSSPSDRMNVAGYMQNLGDLAAPPTLPIFPSATLTPKVPVVQAAVAKPPPPSAALDLPVVDSRNVMSIDDILLKPGRDTRPKKIVVILRGAPGSGKTYVAKLIKEKEVAMGGSAPRILSIDDYFMTEVDKEERCPKTGRKIVKKEMAYEYEKEMEETYNQYLLKSLKKTMEGNLFDFVIVDNINNRLRCFMDFYNAVRYAHCTPYAIELKADLETCLSNNIHNRSKDDIEKMLKNWDPLPGHVTKLDIMPLLQSAAITEVEMEDISDIDDKSEKSDSEANDDDDTSNDVKDDEVDVTDFFRSKWDTDTSEVKLARLDGVSKRLQKSETIEDYLQMDGWEPPSSSSNNKKRVRWADIEEKRAQDKMRAIGFVVGQTDWKRMMDPTAGQSALTKTKYIERVKKN